MGNRQLCLARRPEGALHVDDFDVVETPVRRLADGEVLVRNTWLSIDPSLRIRLHARTPDGYLPPLAIGEPLAGLALGEVVDSRSPDFAVGELVSHTLGYRDLAILDGDAGTFGGYGAPTRIVPHGFPAQWFLGPLGSSGLTAYVGVTEILRVAPDDTVWVSAAAGAVGSLVAQLARQRGATVIGSAGRPSKVDHLLVAFGLDAAFDHRARPLTESLEECAPEGITMYFDSVGGGHLTAALDALRSGGRIAVCGAISGYDAGAPVPGPHNLFQLVSKSIRMEGYRAGSFNHLSPAMQEEVGDHLAAGRIRFDERVFDGLESAPAAMVAMLHGDHIGKTLVALGERN
ncbi:NADP-dependent oxidoreductase [Gordonia sp. KTR9]|uniref:NADP-dependent oxidoreductase n=1 Tax=Gordonia sp. KTR9 TaxID=337191 RepID=UPI0005C8A29F|nr:NADP-dependent oxidoreductase [Gordonia sp. KTR9]